MEIITKEVSWAKRDDIENVFGFKPITIYKGNLVLKRYTDGEVVYDIKSFNTGKSEVVRVDIDEYFIKSDRVTLVATPHLREDLSSNEAKEAFGNFLRKKDFYRNEVFKEDLEEFLGLFEKYGKDVVLVDLDYIREKGWLKDERISYYLEKLSPDLCTGRMAYTIKANVEVDGVDYCYSIKEKKMPFKEWAKVRPFFDIYYDRSDNFDPMWDVSKGTYYTFQLENVQDVLKKMGMLKSNNKDDD